MGCNDTNCLSGANMKMSRADLVNRICLSTEHTTNTLSIGDKRDQTACKPGSVPSPWRGRGGHSSGPVLAGRFSRPTRTPRAGEALPGASSRRDVPIRSCSRRGLPCRPRRRVRGGLVPHPFTLAGRREGRLRRFAFCGAIPGVAPGGCYPSPFHRGARTFLPRPGGRERPPGRLIRPKRRLQQARRQAWARSSAISRARVSPSAIPSTSSGRQWR